LWGEAGDGTVTVTEETENECSGSSETFEVFIDDCTGFDEVSTNTLIIYPNPATDQINTKSEVLINTIKILDFTGKEVAYEHVNNMFYQVNASKLKSGIYLLVIKTVKSNF